MSAAGLLRASKGSFLHISIKSTTDNHGVFWAKIYTLAVSLALDC